MATYDSIITRTEVGEGAGTLLPEAQRREIIQGMVTSSAVLSLGRQQSMSTKHEKQPLLSAFPDAYWVSGDTGLKETTEMEWDTKEMIAEELAVIVPIPINLLADTQYDLWGEIRPRVVEKFGVALDKAVLFGTNAPASFEASVVEAAVTAGNTVNVSATGDDASDVSSVMSLVEEDGFEVNGFAARTRLKARLRNLRATTGETIYSPSLTSGTPSSLWGEPIIYSDANGAWRTEGVDLIAGDWSKLRIGIRADISSRLFTEGVISDGSGNVGLNLMQQDAVAMRFVARYAFTVDNPINLRNEDEDTRYPFSVLETAEGS